MSHGGAYPVKRECAVFDASPWAAATRAGGMWVASHLPDAQPRRARHCIAEVLLSRAYGYERKYESNAVSGPSSVIVCVVARSMSGTSIRISEEVHQ